MTLVRMEHRGTNALWSWPIFCVIGFIAMTIHIVMSYKEFKKRTSPQTNVLFISKWLKRFSTVCFLCGILSGFLAMIQLLPGICYIGWHIKQIIIHTQGVSMGFFQLSRLYYCFSQSTSYSDLGYSNKLFIIMYGIGIFILISSQTVWLRVNLFCGIDQHYRYAFHIADYIMPNLLFHAFNFVIYIIWDWITLGLYIHKFAQCMKWNKTKSQQNGVENRVKLILMRIIICTLFYQIVFIVFMVVVVFSNLSIWVILHALFMRYLVLQQLFH